MNTKDFILLQTLYKEKNITHTARRLFMSQPAVSERLKRLEEEFQCQLFIRQPRGIAFTPEGESLFQYYKDTHASYERMKQVLSDPTESRRGTLHIGCSNVFAKYHMPQILWDFKQLYPHIEIHMKTGYSSDRYRDLLNDTIQLCIMRGEQNWQEHKVQLMEENLCILSAYPIDLTVLPHEPFIRYSTDPMLQIQLHEWWHDNYRVAPLQTIEVDDMDTGLKLVEKGLGYTILSESCLRDYPELYNYPLCFSNTQPLRRSTWAYYRHNYEQFWPLKQFIEFLTSYMS